MHSLARAGIPGLSDLRWGTHCCHFYDTRDDLVRALVPYFKAGLDGGEACLWVASEPLRAAEARSALAAVTPDLHERERRGQIEIVDHEDWYGRASELDAAAMVQAWIEREQMALARGYSGLRLSGNPAWGERDEWDMVIAYEQLVDHTFRDHRILALCSYCLSRCSGQDVLDVVGSHQCTAVRTASSWRIGGSSLLDSAPQELSRMQQAAEALASADRRKDEFIALLGHELRNPLAPIATAVELMRLRGSERDVRELDIIDRQLQHLNTLVDDMLDVSRIARGTLRLHKQPMRLREILALAVEVVTPRVQRHRHRLSVHDDASDATDVWIDADADRLVQAFSNVLTNAAKYTAPGGEISVILGRESAHAVVTVTDNGPGISADVLPHVFELFVQGERAIGRRDGGLGLGLPLVKHLVELHRGTVELTSSGSGTSVVIRLPVADAAEVEQKSSAHAAPRTGGHRRLLLVDDNEDAAVLLGEALEQLDYDVRIASNAHEALDLAERWLPDIAILDIGLPGMDGYELARRIRSIPPLQRMRLIAVTGYGTPDAQVRAQQAGFDHHLTKPVRMATLGSMLLD